MPTPEVHRQVVKMPLRGAYLPRDVIWWKRPGCAETDQALLFVTVAT